MEKHKRFSPPFSLYPSALSLFCVILLTLPVRAQYMRSGLLNWTYDDFAVKTTEGTRKAAGFSQSYSYSVDGPLGSPMVGEGGASLNWAKVFHRPYLLRTPIRRSWAIPSRKPASAGPQALYTPPLRQNKDRTGLGLPCGQP